MKNQKPTLTPQPPNRPRSEIRKPKGIRDLPRFLSEVVGGFFKRLFYIIGLVYETSPFALFLLFFLCIANGVLPVAGAFLTSNLLSAIQVLLTDGVSFSATSVGAFLTELTTGPFQPVFWLLVFQFVYMFLSRILHRVSMMTNSISGDLVSNHIKLKIMEKAREVDLASFDRPGFYERMENANREATHRPIQILRATFDVISTVISAGSFIVVLVGLSAWAPVFIVVCAIPTALVSVSYRTKNFFYMRHRSKERRQMDYCSTLVTDKDRAKENRIMNLSGSFIAHYKEVFRRYYAGIRRLVLREGFVQTLIGLLSLVVNCGLFTYVAYRVVALGEPIGNYSLYTGALTSLAGYVTTLITSTATIYEGTLFIDNMMIFMKEKVEIVPTKNPPRLPQKGGRHTIEFRNVSFRYPGTDRDVLHKINLFFDSEETVVIVGLNGAGKTTLIKLLTRLYDPTDGVILLDGVDLREYDTAALYDLFGIIFQDFGKYAFSVRENITFGDVSREVQEELVKEAAVKSNAHDFIMQLPNGYDTPLMRFFEENGIELSIGQWQKLAIARAFYKDSDIMILDEPTASLDPMAEQEIFNQFAALGNQKITVFVSHRLSSATMASQILVMENGMIIEKGNHSDLMRLHGKYHTLFSTQASRYHSAEEMPPIR